MPGIRFFVFLAISAGLFAQSKSAVGWQSSYEHALDAAKETSKPILIEFWASWCGPCQKMDREVWPDPRIVELSKKFVCVSVDMDRDGDVGDRYFIKVLPTMMLLDPWGRILARRDGFVHVSDLGAMMQQVPGDYAEVKAARDILERDSKNTRALIRLAEFYQKHKVFALSSQHYRDALKTGAAGEDEALRRDLELAIALNHVREGDWKAGRKALERFLVQYPGAPREDEALLALVLAQIRLKKPGEAGQTFDKLKAKFPSSNATEVAADLLAHAGDAPPR